MGRVVYPPEFADFEFLDKFDSHLLCEANVWFFRNLEDVPRPVLQEGYSIRTFRNGDEAAWADVLELAFTEFCAGKSACAQGEREAELWEWLPEHTHFAVFEDEIVSVLTTYPASPIKGFGRLGYLGVLPAHRRRGLARALVCTCLWWFVEHGYPGLVVVTGQDVVSANALYVSFGFVPGNALTQTLVEALA